MKKIVFVIILLLSPLAAVAVPTVVVKGVVISFDQKTIVLKNGIATLVVPRASYPDLKKVVVGRTVIEVRMTPQEALDLNPNFPKK